MAVLLGSIKSDKKYTQKELKTLIDKAYKSITRKKGKSYSPNVFEIQNWIDNYLNK
jgi:hypothetical protein